VSSSVPLLSPAQLRAALDVRDLSDPAAGPHAIQVLTDRVITTLARTWPCEVRWCRGPRVVPVADNYDRLGYAPGAITREARYTRYVSASRMLRSHSSAMVPPALRRLARRPGGDDVLLACPGMVYRRDAIDWQHSGTPTPYDRLPEPAARRLGARRGQKNLLVRVVLRDLETTLTNEAANVLRDRIYLAIHQGSQHQWAVTSSP
jgi:hypothetical protein